MWHLAGLVLVKKTARFQQITHEYDFSLTSTMEIKLHKCHRAMNTIVVGVVVAEVSNPCKVRLIQVILEWTKTMLQNCFGVVLIER